MKKFKFFGVALLLGVMALFQSCDDGDGYSIGDIAFDYVTVHVQGGNSYSFTGDAWGTIWPAAPTFINGFRPVDGQRAFLVFNPLYDDFQGYDVAVKVEDIKPILTKQVETISAADEEAYGDDPVRITDSWMAGGYMNIIFNQQIPMSHKHRVSLVENTDKQYDDDGYIHLEYRYNTYGDTLNPVMIRSIVSYNLNSVDLANKKGVKMRINSAVNGERILQFDSKNQAAPEDVEKPETDTSYME